MSGRVKRGAASRRSRISKRVVVKGIAVLVVLSGVVVWTVYFSSLLGLQHIEVSGEQNLSEASVRDTLTIPLGTPLALVDIEAAESTLELIDQIESAEVTRGWPDTLVVTVIERSPLAAVSIAGTTWLLDRFGVLFAQVSVLPPGLVWLQVAIPSATDDATMAGLEVIQSLDASIRSVLATVRAANGNEVELELLDGRRVLWGGPEDSARKATVLSGLLASGVLASVYDVRSPTSAVLR